MYFVLNKLQGLSCFLDNEKKNDQIMIFEMMENVLKACSFINYPI